MRKLSLVIISWVWLAITLGAQPMENRRDLSPLITIEREFAENAAKSGTKQAFLNFIADSAIIFRPQPVNGKSWLEAHPASSGRLSWQPTWAEISAAADFGYTTGPWEYFRQPEDHEAIAFGQYVTVWQLQTSGGWKFILDLGSDNPPPVTPAVAPPTTQMEILTPEELRPASAEIRAQQLAAVEQQFITALNTNGGVPVYTPVITRHTRLLRSDHFPLVGPDSVLNYLKKQGGNYAFEMQSVQVAVSGDLGFVRGAFKWFATAPTDLPTTQGFYVRIWKQYPRAHWQLALEILSPLPPEKK